jgi:hypothetical protein
MKSKLVSTSCTLALTAVVLSGVTSRAQGQDITVRIIEEPYRPVRAFLMLHFEGLGQRDVFRGADTVQTARQIGLGIGLMSARRTNLQFRTNLAWRQLTVTDFGDPERISMFDMQLGGRFYPLRPTVALGNMAVRLTLGALGGFAMANSSTTGTAFLGSVDLNGGFAFSVGNDPGSLFIEGVYRPIEDVLSESTVLVGPAADRIVVSPSWSIRFGFQFAPSS